MSTAGKLLRSVEAKTANYTVTLNDYGKVLTNRGASGAVVFTFPAAASSPAGMFVDVLVVANQDVTIATAAGELVAFNDATANSIAFSTADEKVGSGVTMICDGTSWIAQVHLGAETATPTIAT